MTKQKCVRTYDSVRSTHDTSYCCTELSEYLNDGWKVVFVTPRTDYTEYIIEREVDDSRME